MKEISYSLSAEFRRLFEKQSFQLSAIKQLIVNALYCDTDQQVCEMATEILLTIEGVNRVSIYLLKAKNHLEPVAAANIIDIINNDSKPLNVAQFKTFKVGDGIIGKVAFDGEQQYIADCKNDPNFVLSNAEDKRHPGSLICSAIKQENQVIGAINITSRIENDFDEWHLRFFPIFCSILASLILNVRLIKHMGEEIQHRTKQANKAMSKARDENKLKTDFILGMSHDLRTPLNAIIGFAQLLKMQCQDQEVQDAVEDIDLILDAGHYLTKLINQVLEVASIESGGLKFNTSIVNVDNLIHQSISLVSQQANSSNITITKADRSEPCPHIQVDESRAQQVLLNILTNAIKYNRRNGNVTVDYEIIEEDIFITVEDEGHGIPEDKLMDVFAPFKRLGKEMSDIEGAGIGLSLSKTLMEKMGGEIGLENGRHQGSRFWIKFPLYDNTRVDTQNFAVKKSINNTQGANFTKILYVENDAVNRRLFEKTVQLIKGCSLLLAKDVNRAIVLIDTHHPDLILTDIELPEINGLELIRTVKRSTNIPIIAVSGNVSPQAIEEALKNGACEFVSKPFEIDEIIETIKKYID